MVMQDICQLRFDQNTLFSTFFYEDQPQKNPKIWTWNQKFEFGLLLFARTFCDKTL
jgi:hypothetical protein